MNPVWRFLLLLRRICVKLSVAFTLLLAGSENILTSKSLSLLFNLLSSIERTRTFVNGLNAFAASPLDGPEADDKAVGKNLRKNFVEME